MLIPLLSYDENSYVFLPINTSILLLFLQKYLIKQTQQLLQTLQSSFLTKYSYIYIYFSYILNTNFPQSIPYTSLHHTKFISQKVPIHTSHLFFHTYYKIHIPQIIYIYFLIHLTNYISLSLYISQIHFLTKYL